ncbi:hypothetical protein V1282_006907 [Nitrobacteraceae bacterium AZCC 2146]
MPGMVTGHVAHTRADYGRAELKARIDAAVFMNINVDSSVADRISVSDLTGATAPAVRVVLDSMFRVVV